MCNFTSGYGHRWAALNKIDPRLRAKRKHRLLKVKAVPFKRAFTLYARIRGPRGIKIPKQAFGKTHASRRWFS